MSRSIVFLALSALLLLTPQAKATAPACLPSATLDQLPAALDDAISGPGDKDRMCLRQLVLPDARLVLVTGEERRVLTLDEWINAMNKRGGTVLFERQVKVKTETFGRIAHLWNTYEIRPTADGKATTRGINSIQAIFDGQSWRVLAVLWQAETPAVPIPEKYLP
jgi:hypothetical protein